MMLPTCNFIVKWVMMLYIFTCHYLQNIFIYAYISRFHTFVQVKIIINPVRYVRKLLIRHVLCCKALQGPFDY